MSAAPHQLQGLLARYGFTIQRSSIVHSLLSLYLISFSRHRAQGDLSVTLSLAVFPSLSHFHPFWNWSSSPPISPSILHHLVFINLAPKTWKEGSSMCSASSMGSFPRNGGWIVCERVFVHARACFCARGHATGIREALISAGGPCLSWADGGGIEISEQHGLKC